MSADNWTYCPFCKEEALKAYESKLKSVNELYGKIPADDYIKKQQEASIVPEFSTTLREDYWLGIQEGEDWFEINYSCSCEKCNRRFEFKHSQKPNWT